MKYSGSTIFRRDPYTPTLSWDLFYYIMRFFDRKADLSLLMRTCKTLYDLGLPPLAHECDLATSELPGALDSFCDFMLGDPGKPLLMRSLTLPPFMDDLDNGGLERAVNRCARVIAEARHLKHLRVHSIEAFLECSQWRMHTAIVSLEELKSVIFIEGGRLTSRLISEMRSSPTHITIDILHDPDAVFEPISLLSRFRETLTTVQYSNSRPILAGPSGITYPHVTTLDLEGPFLTRTGALVISLENLSTVFPAVNRLLLDLPASPPPPVVENIRDMTLGRRQRSRVTWDPLLRLTCSLLWAYALAFKCVVKYWHGAFLRGASDIFWLHTVLDDMRPVHLDLAFHAAYLREHHIGLHLFKGPSPSVTHLHINLIVDPVEEEFEWLIATMSRRETFVFEGPPGDLKHVPLKVFSICFEVKAVAHTLEEEDVIDSFCSQADFDEYALKLARLLPNLESVCVQLLQVMGQLKVNVWNVKRSQVETQEDGYEENVMLERLGDVDARKFMRETPFGPMLLWL